MEASSIIADGENRLLPILWEEKRKEVEAEYADRLENARYFKRWWLLRRVNREIERRRRREASPYSVF